jgi:hypothetical protein
MTNGTVKYSRHYSLTLKGLCNIVDLKSVGAIMKILKVRTRSFGLFSFYTTLLIQKYIKY